jgi:hypothetical protein
MNRLIELDIIVRTLIGRLVELHGAANLADYLEHLAHQMRRRNGAITAKDASGSHTRSERALLCAARVHSPGPRGVTSLLELRKAGTGKRSS